ncbi:MAG: hypothetical protein HY355_05855, partial [Armatimonadetes bacterium]|nr:hypothetical protein [Armatimonadota bacterium]
MALVAAALLGGMTLATAGESLRALGRGAALILAALLRLTARLLALVMLGTWRLGILLARAAIRGARDVARLGEQLLADLGRQAAKIREEMHRRQAVAEPAPAYGGPPVDLPAAPAGPGPVGPPPGEPQGGPITTPISPEEQQAEAAQAGPGEPEALTRRRGRQAASRPSGEGRQERLDFSSIDFRLPPLSMLGDQGTRNRARVDPADTARALEQTLASFGVEAKVIHWEVGPVVTRYEVQPAPGVKVQKITSLTQDIALNLAAQSVRIEAPIPGKSAVGIE